MFLFYFFVHSLFLFCFLTASQIFSVHTVFNSLNRFCCCVFKKRKKRGVLVLIYWCLVLCSCILLLFVSVFCVGGRFGWVGGRLLVDEGSVLGQVFKLINFCTYMDYLYCMPKWSHSHFYEIKLLINISIYWYIKFIKTFNFIVWFSLWVGFGYIEAAGEIIKLCLKNDKQ